MINSFFVVSFASAVNPGAIKSTIVALKMKNMSDMKIVIIMERLIKVEYIAE